jgi:glutamine synthetase
MGHRPGPKGGYCKVDPIDSRHDSHGYIPQAMAGIGLEVEKYTTRSRRPGANRP